MFGNYTSQPTLPTRIRNALFVMVPIMLFVGLTAWGLIYYTEYYVGSIKDAKRDIGAQPLQRRICGREITLTGNVSEVQAGLMFYTLTDTSGDIPVQVLESAHGLPKTGDHLRIHGQVLCSFAHDGTVNYVHLVENSREGR